jgi:hypothetical protein
MARLKDSPNYEHIVKSLDFRYGRRQTLIMVITSAVIFLVERMKYPDPEQMRRFLILWAVMMAPVTLWCLIRWLDIFIKPDAYVFFTAKLDQPNLGYKRGVYYTINGTDRQGRPIVANTRKMFSNLFSPTFEEYNNLKVLVGYNERTGRVIIVRKAIYD